MNHYPFVKIDGYWWEIKDEISPIILKVEPLVRVENQLGGYHYYKLKSDSEIKYFTSRTEAWYENSNEKN